jgi:hypothetical protein
MWQINERDGFENTIVKGSRLYQQFLVDAFVDVEEDRLDYVRANQNDLITGTYQGIYESVLEGDAEANQNDLITGTYQGIYESVLEGDAEGSSVFNWQNQIHDQ